MSHPLDRVTLDADSYRAVRAQTDALAAPLSAEDMLLQSMREASPTKWHLAHTSWFFETFVLERAVPGYVPFQPPGSATGARSAGRPWMRSAATGSMSTASCWSGSRPRALRARSAPPWSSGCTTSSNIRS